MRVVLPSCVLRSWEPGDAPALVRHANDPAIAARLRDAFPHPYGPEDAERFLALARSLVPESYFAIEAGGAAVGGIGFRPGTDVERFSAEVGYWVGRAWWGRGLATEALGAVCHHAFHDLGLVRLWAVPFADNPASARVLEKVGFAREGTLRRSAVKAGRILDQWLYARIAPTLPPGVA